MASEIARGKDILHRACRWILLVTLVIPIGLPGRTAHLAQGESQVLQQGIEKRARPRIAYLLLDLLDSAKFDPRGALRFVRRHARANVFLYQHFEVGMNLLVEVCVHTPG